MCFPIRGYFRAFLSELCGERYVFPSFSVPSVFSVVKSFPAFSLRLCVLREKPVFMFHCIYLRKSASICGQYRLLFP
ncbi:hypothetical protein Selin_1874 [Desulfurispirillum indicum S5]|uniref:Uncharacterized protein n=1 Tax=Desulfurispirillum indicum (strain ATCC BAA-1389 / DSM 22839 / S5) TaxID=653733 RepID=E6W1Q2_DESIS|nr:hypothetical protein Selin_1874 [Desulfurispirillum indicum S5]